MSSVSWRDFRASLARNLNRRCSRLERARRSFRLIRSPLFAYGDAPLGRRSARSPTALQAACPNPRLDMQNPGYPQGASGILCRSGGIRTRGLLVPNQTRYQTALHLDTGADEGTRTPDLLITNRLLYQLSHIGTTSKRYYNKGKMVCPALFLRAESTPNQ